MSSREETYCVKERKYTKNINPTIKTSKNGNKYIQSTCFVCGNKKSSFIKTLRGQSQSLQNSNKNGFKRKSRESQAKSNKNGKSVDIKKFFTKK